MLDPGPGDRSRQLARTPGMALAFARALRQVDGMDTGTDTSQGTLGIIAGGGPMPLRVAAAAQAAGRAVFVVALEGFAEPARFGSYRHAAARIGAAGRILDLLRENGVRDVVLIGTVRRPSFFDLRPDAEGAKLLARVGRAAFAGDDGLLAAVVRVLGEMGFNVVGAHDVLQQALAPSGLLTRTAPDALALSDVARGIDVARKLGQADVGQGCIVQQGLVLAVEAIEGTDAMLRRSAELRVEGPGGVLVKIVKPGQERRVDLPTLGATTVALAAAAGLRGIAFESGGAMLAERAEAIALADRHGMFLLGVDPARFDPGRPILRGE